MSVGAPVGVLIWGFHQMGLTMPQEVAAWMTTALIGIALFIGKKGLRGLVMMIWRGQEEEENE